MSHKRTTCKLCIHSAAEGWWGVSGVTHCRDCGRTWSGTAEAHCVNCHEHFSSNSAADRHDKKGGVGCYSPQSMKRRGMQRVDTKWGWLWRGPAREGGWQGAATP